eukprot:124435-Rhodomonas_salina.3
MHTTDTCSCVAVGAAASGVEVSQYYYYIVVSAAAGRWTQAGSSVAATDRWGRGYHDSTVTVSLEHEGVVNADEVLDRQVGGGAKVCGGLDLLCVEHVTSINSNDSDHFFELSPLQEACTDTQAMQRKMHPYIMMQHWQPHINIRVLHCPQAECTARLAYLLYAQEATEYYVADNSSPLIIVGQGQLWSSSREPTCMPRLSGLVPSTPAQTGAFPSQSSRFGHTCPLGFPPLPLCARLQQRSCQCAAASARLCTMQQVTTQTCICHSLSA